MSILHSVKVISSPNYPEEEFDSSSSNQGEEFSSSDNYTSGEEEVSEEMDDTSDFSVDEVVISFEPIRSLAPTTINANGSQNNPPNPPTKGAVEFVPPAKKVLPQSQLKNDITPNFNAVPLKSPHNPRKVIPPPPPPFNRKIQLTKEEIKKLELENNKQKNKFGFIRKEDFLFCCVTSARTKSLRFFKRLIVMEEGTILCHLTSSTSSILYSTKDGSIFEDDNEKREGIRTIKPDIKNRRLFINGYEDVAEDSEEDHNLESVDESSDDNLMKKINPNRVQITKKKDKKKQSEGDESEEKRKYKYELIYLKNCWVSQIIFDAIDRKYFFHISSNTSPKKYFFLSEDLSDLYLWFLAIQSNIENSVKFTNNVELFNSQGKPINEDTSNDHIQTFQRALSTYSSNLQLKLPLVPTPPPPPPPNFSRSKGLGAPPVNSAISTDYTCISVSPFPASNSPSPTSPSQSGHSKSPRKSPRRRSHRRHVSLTTSSSPIEHFDVLPLTDRREYPAPHSPKKQKHKKRKKSDLDELLVLLQNSHIPSSPPQHYEERKVQVPSDNNNNNNNNVVENQTQEVKPKPPSFPNVQMANTKRPSFDRAYAADDEGDIKVPMKKPTPYTIVPFIKANPSVPRPAPETVDPYKDTLVSQPSKNKNTKILHGYEMKFVDSSENAGKDSGKIFHELFAPGNSKPSRRAIKTMPPRTMSPSFIPEVEEMDFSFLDKK